MKDLCADVETDVLFWGWAAVALLLMALFRFSSEVGKWWCIYVSIFHPLFVTSFLAYSNGPAEEFRWNLRRFSCTILKLFATYTICVTFCTLSVIGDDLKGGYLKLLASIFLGLSFCAPSFVTLMTALALIGRLRPIFTIPLMIIFSWVTAFGIAFICVYISTYARYYHYSIEWLIWGDFVISLLGGVPLVALLLSILIFLRGHRLLCNKGRGAVPPIM